MFIHHVATPHSGKWPYPLTARHQGLSQPNVVMMEKELVVSHRSNNSESLESRERYHDPSRGATAAASRYDVTARIQAPRAPNARSFMPGQQPSLHSSWNDYQSPQDVPVCVGYHQSQGRTASSQQTNSTSYESSEITWDDVSDYTWDLDCMDHESAVWTNQMAPPAALDKQHTTPAAIYEEDGDTLRCYDHGCNGQLFSSAENLRRHNREREGSGRAVCLLCGMSFTRKSNRDTHIAMGRCRGLDTMFSTSD